MNKNLENFLEEFSQVSNEWFKKNNWLYDNYNFFQKFLTKNKIEKAEWEDFQELAKHIHAFNMPIARKNAFGKLNLPIENYRQAFLYIIESDDEIDTIIDNLLDADYKLPYIGKSAISEIIGNAFPNNYVYYNERDIKALKILDIDIKKKRGETFGKFFKRYNEEIEPIINKYKEKVGQKTKTTIPLEVDQFFSWLTEKHSDKINEDTSQIYQKPENDVNENFKDKNFIFYGPPGTGKTYLFKNFINQFEENNKSLYNNLKNFTDSNKKSNDILIDKNRYKFICFHQSYSYEDFIEGYKPSPVSNKDNSKEMIIERQEGFFKKFVEAAKDNPDENYYFVIDEINRGNVSKIFGELITLIEEDKRSEDWAVKLQYSGETFYIPDNVYLIGTMNTADKSIANIDVALRRRFTFVRMDPKSDLIPKNDIKRKNGFKNLNGENPENLRKWFAYLNEYIEKEIDKDHAIGHSYLMNIRKDEELQFQLDYKIKPLLEEYFYHEDSDTLDNIQNYCEIELVEDNIEKNEETDNKKTEYR